MKILFFDPTSGPFSGAQKVTFNILKSLSINSEIIAFIRKPKTKFRLSLENACHVRTLPLESTLSKIFGQATFDSQNKFFKLIFLIKYFLIILYLNIFCLFQAIKSKPSYIYTYDPSGLVATSFLSGIFGYKVIWHLHGELRYPKFVQRILYHSCHSIIVPSNYIKENLLYSSKVKVIYNGFSFSEKKERLKKSKSTEILYMGTIVPHKGLHLLIESLHGINDLKINVNVLGEGLGANSTDYKIYIDNLISQLNSNINVNFHGWVDDIFNFLFLSDILVFPSIEEGSIFLGDKKIRIRSSEALPTVLIESLACGVPVIASNVAGVKEIVSKKNYGIIIKNSETKSLQRAIVHLIKNSKDFEFDPNEIKLKFAETEMEKKICNLFNS